MELYSGLNSDERRYEAIHNARRHKLSSYFVYIQHL
jgi:hypothetical protein